jgi:hypothetical protein
MQNFSQPPEAVKGSLFRLQQNKIHGYEFRFKPLEANYNHADQYTIDGCETSPSLWNRGSWPNSRYEPSEAVMDLHHQRWVLVPTSENKINRQELFYPSRQWR